MHINIHPLEKERKKAKFTDEKQLGFGKVFTDRMFLMEWRADKGWFNAQIKAYEPFLLDPSSLIFHYGQQVFEGLKAFKWNNGTVALFRPEMNARRFNLSADRLCMPTLPEELFLEAIETLVSLEKEWIPTGEGASLYIRPVMIAVESMLGVRASSHYYFYIILSPVGAYYTSGFNPIKMLIEDQYIRAAPGGTGEAKTGCNYAGTLKASLEAKTRGFDQVVWLDSTTRSYIEEGGAMNMFFVYPDKILTPKLEGSILSGITRDSILQIADSLGCKTEEERILVDALMQDIQSGKVKEVFCSGTAAVITPVGALCYKKQILTINGNQTGEMTQKFYDILTHIQCGKIKDPFGWMREVVKPEKRALQTTLHAFLEKARPVSTPDHA